MANDIRHLDSNGRVGIPGGNHEARICPTSCRTSPQAHPPCYSFGGKPISGRGHTDCFWPNVEPRPPQRSRPALTGRRSRRSLAESAGEKAGRTIRAGHPPCRNPLRHEQKPLASIRNRTHRDASLHHSPRSIVAKLPLIGQPAKPIRLLAGGSGQARCSAVKHCTDGTCYALH